ncbi:glycine/D-amino acid oxidase-like deaminating enzyme [Chitinophaga skermanii]|uniref:Glycine/D-amino acid oxidase-like deaminating enzyme n=1 Tax=Chitinophaga skermanii TaxID=331697 RepID=A0A327R4F1_9BACT|nr:FAD-binding oxidoreductase [Chitinophaga skermanii]RAJ10644.1 glycine/D-amino acid oxidase-like deaminating enzyme [Chitinophaga skermanii]
MSYDYIIVGQGIAGTLTSWLLQQRGCSVLVYNEGNPRNASNTAAGIINPVSGRLFETAWRYDEMVDVAKLIYQSLSETLQIEIFKHRDIYTVWPSKQMHDAFEKALNTSPYLATTEQLFSQQIIQPQGAGIIKGAQVLLHALLPAYTAFLESKQLLRKELFNIAKLELLAEGVRYNDISAQKVIFCNGAANNPYLPEGALIPTKGEALVVRVPGLDTDKLIKKRISLVPLWENAYWAGASLTNQFENALPTSATREWLEKNLHEILAVPYEVVDHWAAIRPATADRRPLVGLHPTFPQLAFCNGFGTKGCSIGPFAALGLVDLLTGKKTAISPEIDINRYFTSRQV